MNRIGWNPPLIITVVPLLVLILSSIGLPNGITPPPDALRFFQGNKEAAELFSKLKKEPGNLPTRKKLAALYSQSGNDPMSHMIQATADYLEFKLVRFPKQARTERGTMSCPGSVEELTQMRAATKDIGPLLEHLKDREAVEKLDRMLTAEGASCQLASEWAYAIVHSGIDYPENTWTTWEARELAARWLITVAEEIKEFPQYRMGEAPIYETLTSYFSANGDYVSAYLCASRAIEWANAGSIGLADKKSFCDRMQARLEKLRTLAQKIQSE